LTLGGTAYHDGNPHRFTLTAGDLAEPSVFAAGFNLRMTVGLGRWFLLGTELDISSGGSPEGEVTHGDQSLTAGDVSALTGGVIFGVALPVGPLRFRGELFAGGQGIDVTATSVLGDCVSETSAILTRWVIEPRIGIELFLTPSLSVDLWGGADVVNPGNLAGGLRLNLHARGYDAVR
jgi:hypothetical protein